MATTPLVQARLDQIAKLAADTVMEESKLGFKPLSSYALMQVELNMTSYEFKPFWGLPLEAIERCFGSDLAHKLVLSGHIHVARAAPAVGSQPAQVMNTPQRAPAALPKGEELAQANPPRELAAQTKAPQPAQATKPAPPCELQTTSPPAHAAVTPAYANAARAAPGRAVDPPATPIRRAPATANQAVKWPAGKDQFLQACVNGAWAGVAVKLPITRRDNGAPATPVHPQAKGFLLADKKYFTHRADVRIQALEPTPRCRYLYGADKLEDPSIKFHNQRDREPSSGAINVKLLSNDQHHRWNQLGKQDPGLCYGWFLQARCEHGSRCTLRHIKLTSLERADLAWWNPVLLWFLDDADKRRRATNAYTQWFPDQASCLKYIEGCQAAGEKRRASPRASPEPAKRQRISRWGPELV
ncbi:hypothetical protein N0V83_009015 [Neocucurbitaria cava]|uniref:C3H1-type domain-containing protein n=1 Tax=Neocucurbitaria cava TaxID=798079 RepID=A0A9W8Y1U0_9PLEO|nr:hypothetical protein N0V83_009015 [Neocucurbitaria cava]